MPEFLVGLHGLQSRPLQRAAGTGAVHRPGTARIDIAERLRGAVIPAAQAVVLR